MNSIAITGHRPEKLVNLDWIEKTLKSVLQNGAYDFLYQGMAAGVDLMSAKIAYEIGLPFIAVKPWAGHQPRNSDKELYTWVLDNAHAIVNVNPHIDYTGPRVYHKRNEFMVDNSNAIIGVWDGENKGGTAACIRYAHKQQKPLIHLNPITRNLTYPLTFQEPTLF